LAPEGWRSERLDKLASFIGRGMAPSYTDEESQIYAISQKCIRGGRVRADLARAHARAVGVKPEAVLRGGDVCINSTGTGTIGRVGLWSNSLQVSFFADTHVTIVRPLESVVGSKFLVEVLSSPDVQRRIEAQCFSGSTHQVELDRSALCRLDLPIPPLPVQRDIEAVLLSLDDAIQSTQAIIKQLQVVKEAMLAELLTRGIPGRHRFFVETEIGEIPEDWLVIKLGDICSIERGRFIHRPRNDPRFYGGQTPFIQTGDVRASKGRIRAYQQTLNEEGLAMSRLFPAGTIVMTIAANIGETAIACFPVAFPDSLVGFEAGPRVDNRFLELVLRTRKEQLSRLAPQSAQSNINLETLRPLRIQLPPKSEQEDIVSVLEAIQDREDSEIRFLSQLSATKSALLPALLTGEIRVPLDSPSA
jgi:type I restriction enzyme, S subunit